MFRTKYHSGFLFTHDIQLEVGCSGQLLAPLEGGRRARGAGEKGQGRDVPRWLRPQPECWRAGQTDGQQRCEAPAVNSPGGGKRDVWGWFGSEVKFLGFQKGVSEGDFLPLSGAAYSAASL